MKTFFLLSFLADFASAGTITDAVVTHSTQITSAKSTATFVFKAPTTIATDGKIIIDFPSGVVPGTDCAVTAQNNIAAVLTAVPVSQTVTITRSGSGAVTTAGDLLSITLSEITNPTIAGTTAVYSIKTTDSGGSTGGDILATVDGVTFYKALLTATSVLPKSFIADADTRFAIDFTTSTTLAVGSKIEVTFPTNFDLATLAPAMLGTPSGVDGTWAVSVDGTNGQILRFKQTGGTPTTAGAKSFLVSNIGNPAAGASGTFKIETYDGSTLSDLDYEVVGFNIKTSAQRLGSSTKTTIEGSILAVGETGKTCIGKYIQEDCAHASGSEEVCNPYTKTTANLCLPKADVLLGDTAHGKTGTSDAATPKASWCVPHTLDADFETTTAGLEKNCKTTEVCNKASKDLTKTCILKADLIGSITADWTHLGQLRKPAKKIDDTKGNQWCFAKTGTPVLYFAAQCAVSTKDEDKKKPTNTICNPNAKILGDVCIEAYKTLEHGEMATEVKTIVIGDSYYKKDCTFATGSETVANWGAGAEADVCIAKKELLNEAEPLNALRTDAGGAGTDASPLKVCMSKKKTDGTNGSQRCAIDVATTDKVVETEVCNPHGAKGGSDHTLICVLKTRVLGRGEVVTKDDTLKKNICIGVDASSTCLENEACDLTKGTCFMAAGTDSIVLAPWTEAVEGGAANTCVGKETTEKCTGPGYWCNPLGTTADGTVTVDTAKETSICLFADALHINGGSICLTYAEGSDKTLAYVISAIKCGTDEPFCDDEGKCSATETVQEVVDPVVDPVVDYAATTSIWIGVAIAATLW